MVLVRRWRLRELAMKRSDAMVVLALTVPVVASLIATAARDGRPIVLLLIPPGVAAVLLRRRRPGVALGIAVAVAAAMPDDRWLVLPVMAALYTIATRTAWRPAAAAGASAAGVAIIAGAIWGGGSATDRGGLLGYAIGFTASCAAAVAVGLYIGAHAGSARVYANARSASIASASCSPTRPSRRNAYASLRSCTT